MGSAGVRKNMKGSLSFSSNLRPEDGGYTIVDKKSIFDADKNFNESSKATSAVAWVGVSMRAVINR
jgi:hypothetical protein